MANQNISKLLQNKIELLKVEVENAQLELRKWETMADEYNAQPDKFELIATLLVGETAENKKSRKKV
ncbi:hypothetical protein QWY86_12835 [Pedobacter aquatilis]|uniref:hypothetical protein n=1 Tax=Pedobacter aquatilis TaxID=351343 RepID=UPI0025B5C9E5|nr:hypothetical protein [Pedobacter aquatilis]MDN3587560.1 hypothetical protein [Pedobacter aquatilis]